MITQNGTPHPETTPAIEVRFPRPGVAQVVLSGEHDLATREQLDATLARTLETCSHLVVDLSMTQFIDSSTIGVLVATKKRADARGREFHLLVGTEPIVEKVLEITGVLPLLNRVRDLDEALHIASHASKRRNPLWASESALS